MAAAPVGCTAWSRSFPFPERPSYLFEYRYGQGQLYRGFLDGNDLALAALNGYASDGPGWRDLVRWKRFKL